MSDVCFSVVIPARLASTRLPNKPLADIAGKPMVVRVAERAAQSHAKQVVVAADHQSIFDACVEHKIPVIMTSANHSSGTERLAEAAQILGLNDDDLLVNVQGDEPMLNPCLINDIASLLAKVDAPVATAAHEIKSFADFLNPNVVKLVMDASKRAIYFSRAPIPWPRDAFSGDIKTLPNNLHALRHIGIYGYRVNFLHCYAALTPSPVEKIEYLEQLRILWHGYSISVTISAEEPLPGVDTKEDLERIRAYFAA